MRGWLHFISEVLIIAWVMAVMVSALAALIEWVMKGVPL